MVIPNSFINVGEGVPVGSKATYNISNIKKFSFFPLKHNSHLYKTSKFNKVLLLKERKNRHEPV